MSEANQLKELQRASWEDTSAVTALAPGKSVLDVGCGTGQPALSAAQRVDEGRLKLRATVLCASGSA